MEMSKESGISVFNPNEENGNVYAKWTRWLRGLNLFLESKNITESKRKKAMLLHHGGFELQDIFYTIPGADTVADGEDPYVKTVDTLNAFFKPKVNITYERHVFRSLRQMEEETVAQYVTRLRQQAKNCEFKEEDAEICSQIVECCTSSEIRRRILEKSEITVKGALEIAQTIEAIEMQTKNIEGQAVARLTGYGRGQNKGIARDRETVCFRCGYKGHRYKDDRCPAKGRKCNKCGETGHFAGTCRAGDKTSMGRQGGWRQGKSVKELDERNDDGDDDGDDKYTFGLQSVGEVWALGNKTIDAKVGGIVLNLLIDSGTSCNIIDEETWKYCKTKKIRCVLNRNVTDKIYAYGQNKALELLGEFKCNLEIGDRKTRATFVVMKGKGKGIVGYKTAKELGILRVGLEAMVNCNERRYEDEKLFKGIGKLENFKLELPIDRSRPPVAQSLRRVPYKVRDQMQKQIQKLLEEDIIEEVEGPTAWVSLVVPIIKKKGELRLCIDMRRANEVIIRERYPLPVLDEILDTVKGNKWFSTLDIKSAYHQIELSEESRDITTFVTEMGLYRYKRLMFGISCAPEIFQRIMRAVLKGCEGTINFIDDILVCGKSKEEHDNRLKQVFRKLKEKGLTLNKEKCRFGKQEVIFMGFRISGMGYQPLQSKVEAVQKFRIPRTVEEIRSFLGLVNFCAQFIPDLATLSEPLRRLMKKDTKFIWGKEQEQSFGALKERLINAGTLGIYDKEANTRVIADASPVAVGCVLTQKDREGRWRVISYASKSLTECEKRYSQTEKEALALVYACERFYIWLYGIEFELVTDHKALEYIFAPKTKPNARVERWVLHLQQFKYKVVYEKGKTNIADALSRLSIEEKRERVINSGIDEQYVYWVATGAVPKAMTLEEIDYESGKDQLLRDVREAIETGDWNKMEKSRFRIMRNELCCSNNIVLRGARIVIPESLKRVTLQIAHEGHPGIVAMKNRLRSKVWWDGIDKDAERTVRACKGC